MSLWTRQDEESDGPIAPAPTLSATQEGDLLNIVLAGDWTTHSVGPIDGEVRALEGRSGVQKVRIDLSQMGRMDTAGAWLVDRLGKSYRHSGTPVQMLGGTEADDVLLEAIGKEEEPEPPASEPKPFFILRGLEAIGRAMYRAKDDAVDALYILGATIRGGQMKAGRGHSINFAAIVNQIDRMGVGAIPVIVLMSGIVGAIVCQQGAFQLRYFGADIFVVDLVGILVLRELGVLMTAIMVAGRSGSAITAEIGSMKMREEIDAMKVIGLNPVGVLIFPRLLALVIALPCLTIIADFAAIGGALWVGWTYVGIEPVAFLDRMRAAIDYSTMAVGLIKAPFMALVIGIIAAVEGMKVGGSAESLGQQVTSSVVKSIFIVVILDGLFAMFFAIIDF